MRAGPADLVLAAPQRPEFLATLRAAGVIGLPEFLSEVPRGRIMAGDRPYGVAGPHLQRSAVARYRSPAQSSVCWSLAAD